VSQHFPGQRSLLLFVFVLSGFAGLVYQSMWAHYLGLFLGHAAYAQALVLALFMGGMAAGAALVAKAGERWRNLVLGYAIVEAVIGVFGLAFHALFTGALALSYDWLMPALGAPWLVNAWKWLLAALLILPQTVLLGMTFPLLSGGMLRRFPGGDGRALGGLYFSNSIGAAAGALAATFLLLPRVGMPGAMVVAGLTNLAVAAMAWRLAVGRETPPPPKDLPLEDGARRLPLLVLGATALSGAASFVYEIVWVRMLSLAVGTTLHAFELMLASFIAGIALGGLWIRRHADRSRDPLRLAGWMQVAMGIAALLSLLFYANAFVWVGGLMDALSRSDGAYALFNLGTAAIAMAIMLPAALFAGTTLPLFTVALLRGGHGERSIGRVYAWNTAGAILGVFAAVHLLIPLLGLKLALIAAAAVDLAIGLVLLWPRVMSERATTAFAAAFGVGIAGIGFSLTQVPWDPMQLASGVYRFGQTRLPEHDRVIFYRDGKTVSISVIESPGGLRIASNGKVDGSIVYAPDLPPSVDEPTMVLLGALPLAYHPDARNVAVIGFGTGLTSHTVLADPRIERLDTIEIERAMVEGARLFGSRVERAFQDPRSQVVIDDARSFFAGAGRRYDVIISEPSNPWISGVGALFSREFYAFVPRHLTDDGLFVQWLQLYEIDEALVGSVLNALVPAFEDFSAYLANSSDLLIVARPRGRLRAPDLERLFEGALGEELRKAAITDAEALAFRRIADARLLRALARRYPEPANSDYFPRLGIEAPRTRFRGVSADEVRRIPFLKVPVLEWLGVREPLGFIGEAGDFEIHPGEVLTANALDVVRVLRGEPSTALPTAGVVAPAHRLRILGGQCGVPWDEDRLALLAQDLLSVTLNTLPHLPAAALAGALVDPVWLPCPPPDEDMLALLDLIEAMALRADERIAGDGVLWLARETRRESLRAFEPLAYGVVQLAMLRKGWFEEALLLEETAGRRVPASEDYAEARALVLAWLEESRDPGSGSRP
jgi:predicted membrane-bound spermidine synthase